MKARIFLYAGLFAAGIATGVMIMQRDNGHSRTPAHNPASSVNRPAVKDYNPFRAVAPDNGNDQRLHAIEQQVEKLNSRLAAVERTLSAPPADEKQAVVSPGGLNAAPAVDSQASRISQLLTTDNLSKAGIDPVRAEQIVRHKNEIDFRRLELQDRATREGYMGTTRYMRELAEIDAGDIDLREELGDAAFDRFLYGSGQRNRVTASFVMQGSPAEQAGMLDGDVILSYNGARLFDWNELKAATTEGERGEFVNLTVLRDGQQLTLWVPRGPLGVRLGSIRLDPGN
jgi:C-terminal processing protease CtpA/Prc